MDENKEVVSTGRHGENSFWEPLAETSNLSLFPSIWPMHLTQGVCS